MATFTTECPSCGHEHKHTPFGGTSMHHTVLIPSAGDELASTLLEKVDEHNDDVPVFRLPIVEPSSRDGLTSTPGRLGLCTQIEQLAQTLEDVTPCRCDDLVSFPQLVWHERPNWGDKLFFASQRTGVKRRQHQDSQFVISPPIVT